MQAEMQNLMPDQPRVTWRTTLGRASRDVGDLVHDFGWLAGWATRRLGKAAIRGQTLLALRRRLGLLA